VTNKNECKKLPYEKPELKSFSLVAEEVMSVGCKTATAGGGFTGINCIAGGCVATIGS